MPHRTLCRVLFVLLCVAPTVAVAGWTAGRALPGVLASRVAELGDRLGVTLTSVSASTPRPGVIRLDGVALRDQERGEVLAECDWLETCVASREARLRGGRLLVAGGRLPELANAVEGVLREDQPLAFTARWNVVAVVSTGGEKTEWRRVTMTLPEADPALGPEFALRAEPTDQEPPLSLIATRNRQIEPPATRVALTTGPRGLPAEVLARLLPDAFAASGANSADSVFAGEVTVVAGERPEGTLSGEWSRAPLALLAGASGLTLDGPATVAFERLTWSGEQVIELQAVVTTGAGAVDRRWVYAANAALGCVPTDRLRTEWADPAEPPIAFDELAVAVRLDTSGLRLQGFCRDTPTAGGLLARDGETLLMAPSTGRLPLASLVRFVARPDAPLRPTGGAVESLLRHLPASLEEPVLRTRRP